MPNNSYEDFLYDEDQQLHSVYEVQKEYEQNKGDISKYRDKMLCPECKKAKLRFTHKTSERRAFLSTFPTSNHEGTLTTDYYVEAGPRIDSQDKEFLPAGTRVRVYEKLNGWSRINHPDSAQWVEDQYLDDCTDM